MVQLLNSITFIICLAPLILCISNAAERRHEIDVAHGDEDIFRNTPPPLPPPSSPSKIDIYVHDWIRKVLEANETESPADVQKDGNYPPITKDFYQVGMKWIIKKYCLNVSSENACMQVVLKPHVYEEIPLKFRLFRKGIDPDSNVNGLDEKEVLKGYSAKKLKNKYFKDEKNYKNRNAFDQFYKYLIKRKKKLLSSSKNTKSENFIEIVTEQSSLGAFSNSSLEQALKNLKRKGEIKETDKKKAPTFLEKSEYRPGIDQSKKIVYEFLEKCGYDSSAHDSKDHDNYERVSHDPSDTAQSRHTRCIDPSRMIPRKNELVPLPDVCDPGTTIYNFTRCYDPRICKLYCIHGHTFPEGITRETVCELKKGVWSKKFDECLPFVDCTLKLKTAGYLKCTTNTVQTGPRCQVECQRYATKPAVSKKTHQCDVTGRWNPPLPHCVEREGIDVVQPPPNMSLRSMDYP
ncbi:hypothetical protein HNY73_008576 [Argiope bruennichi]|uniref:Sushi domain-containing protein n=1 Tax=Argiope bruennichi TaxID=94029 RepID=A0A8T0F702_ARGBR|nr:hypothetical protein HNY73_008576 [Argiope bruennichi]